MIALLASLLSAHPALTEGEPYGPAQLNAAIAMERIQDVLRDPHAEIRSWRTRLPQRGVSEPDTPLSDALSPDWSPGEAERYLAPLFAHLEARLALNVTAHIALSREVLREKRPVIDAVWRRWLNALDAQGLDLAGTAGAIDMARRIREIPQDWDPFVWDEHGAPLVPMLDEPHPLVACAAAERLGGLFFTGEVGEDPESPPLATFLEALRRPRTAPDGFPRAIAGAFVGGFDCAYTDIFPSAAREAGLDLEAWVLDVLALDHHPSDDSHLGQTLGFWFFIHETYCADPAFVLRLLDAGHDWIAMMTATELHACVPGMEEPLHRLLRSRDRESAERARLWLGRFYSPDDTSDRSGVADRPATS